MKTMILPLTKEGQKVALKVLVAAKELISDPNHWTQAAMARNSKHQITDYNNPEAVSWCAIGAIIKVTNFKEHGPRGFDIPLSQLAHCALPSKPWKINDHDGHAAVMELYAKTINSLKDDDN